MLSPTSKYITVHADPPTLFNATRTLSLALSSIWQQYFADVPQANAIEIAYCRPWKSRLGLIRMSLDGTRSFIGINSLLYHKAVPNEVLLTTIAHELAHYAHGFGSPLPQLYEHPHANNVVTNELVQRGLGDMFVVCDAWINDHWYDFYESQRAIKRKNDCNVTYQEQKAG